MSSEFDDGLSSEIAAAMSAGNVDYATAKAIVHALAARRNGLTANREELARLLYRAVAANSDGYAEPVGDDEPISGLVCIDGNIDFEGVADAVMAALNAR